MNVPANAFFAPAFAYHNNAFNNPAYIAEVVTHEVGHNLGLFHDGAASEYYSGHSDGILGWAPIMGIAYNKGATQWSKGEYPGASNTQLDDVAILTALIGARADDYGNDFASATSVSFQSGVMTEGVIGTRTDVDMFRFDVAAGTTFSIDINVLQAAGTTAAMAGANLNDTHYAMSLVDELLSHTSSPLAPLVGEIHTLSHGGCGLCALVVNASIPPMNVPNLLTDLLTVDTTFNS